MCRGVGAFTRWGVIVQEGKGRPRRWDQWLCCPSARASESCHSDPALTLNIPSLGMPLLAWHPVSRSACRAEIRGTQAFDSRHWRRLPSAEETGHFQLQWRGTRETLASIHSSDQCDLHVQVSECKWWRELSERWTPNPGLSGQRLSHPQEVLSLLWPPWRQTSALETFLPSAARDAVQSLLLMNCAAGLSASQAPLRAWVNWLIGNRPIEKEKNLRKNPRQGEPWPWASTCRLAAARSCLAWPWPGKASVLA